MKRLIIFLLIIWTFFTYTFSQESIAGFEKEVKGVLDKVSPSIVKVVTENHRRYVATGIAIGPDLVLTTTLVVRRPFQRIYVQTVDKKKYNAVIQGKDQRSALTLLRLDKKALTPVKRSQRLKVGEWIALVGVFYNNFPAISQGIVSSYSGGEVILNAPIAPGASGGAVVNKAGQLVAVLRGRVGFSSTPDLSFRGGEEEIVLRGAKQKNMDLSYAIPSVQVMRIASQLEKHGRVKRGYFGVLMEPALENSLAIVDEVLKGSPAEKAGIRKGDRIVSIDEVEVKNPNMLPRLVSNLIPGTVIKVGVERPNAKKLDRVLVKVGELDDRGEFVVRDFGDFSVRVPEYQVFQQQRGALPRVEQFVFQFSGGQKTLGIDVKRIHGPTSGLLVKTVQAGSAAKQAGLKKGDIIVKANGQLIGKISDLRVVLNSLKDRQSMELDVERSGTLRQIKVVPEVKEPGSFNWRDFRDNLKRYSFRLDDNDMVMVQKKLEVLKAQLLYLNSRLWTARRQDLDKLKSEIQALKEKSGHYYRESLKKLEKQKDTIDLEFEDLQRQMNELKKKWHTKEQKKNKKPEKNNTQQSYNSELI
jgi:serine protease Do